MKRQLIISLIILFAHEVYAQMTLNDCLIYARQHAHRNVISRLETDRYGTEVNMSVSSMLPNLRAYSNSNLSFGRNIDPETNTYDNKQTLSLGFGIQMSLPIFDGLVNINNLKAARVAKRRMDATAQIEEDLVSMEVIKAFYQVSYCKAMVSQMQEQLNRDMQDLKATERGLELGSKSGADVAEMRAVTASDEFQLLNQQNLLAKAYLNLRAKMGMELTDDATLDLTEPAEDKSIAIHMKHPRIIEAELAVRESLYYLRAAKGSYSPSVSLTGSVSTSYYKMLNTQAVYPSFGRQWQDNMGEYIGVSFSFPLFNGLASRNRVKRAGIQLKENEVRLEQTIYELEKETREAMLNFTTSADELKAAIKRVKAEEIAFHATRRKYELGQISVIDLYTSGSRLAEAKAEMEGKRIQNIIDNIIMRYCMGEKLIKD